MSAFVLALALLAGPPAPAPAPHVAESGEKDGRLHLQLAGDVLYGGPRAPNLTRLALHAEALTLPDRTTIHAPLAEDLARVRNELS